MDYGKGNKEIKMFDGLHDRLIKRREGQISKLNLDAVKDIEALGEKLKACAGDRKFLHEVASEYLPIVNEETLLYYNNSPMHRNTFDRQIFIRLASDIVNSYNEDARAYEPIFDKCLSCL